MTEENKEKTQARGGTRTAALRTAEQDAFIAAYAEEGTILGGCEVSGVPRRTVYNWKEEPDFAAAMVKAEEAFAEKLEKEALWRATNRERATASSDKMLSMLLRANKPDKYVERFQVENRGDLSVVVSFDDDEEEDYDDAE